MAVLKHSRQRDAIKHYLQGREDHPTADMIYESVRQDFPNISLGTVYRNLSLLTELGEICKITAEGADRFDARTEPHSHFICRQCSRVLDVMVPLEDPLPQVNGRWDGGEIDDYRLEFSGTCADCLKSKK
ncbi:MAG: transcriptional repressor [Lachnospiraceae bacterium]|nr:transcriptional repressor [Lachnospiraceae bacterium]